MPMLVAFVIKHFSNGFLLGAAVALAAILLQPNSIAARFASESPAGLLLLLFALGSSLGMGSLATALCMDIDD